MTETSGYQNPSILIEAHELAASLADDDLRVIDCDIILEPRPEGGYNVISGRDNWAESHIPNSVYVDINEELSAEHQYLRFMLPPAEQFASAISAHGIGDDHRLVLYSRGGNFWATRLFLMFREFGFERVQVLNGAWDKWLSDGLPTTQAAPDWPTASFTAQDPRGRFVGKENVKTAIDDPHACIINALSPSLHSGETFNPPYGRPGHIAGSTNLFFLELIDQETNRFLDAAAMQIRLAGTGALSAERIITYCGGGISATTNAFALMLLGRDDVVVYDGSLMEWGHDDSLPMETGPS